jgi:hypothetical protein
MTLTIPLHRNEAVVLFGGEVGHGIKDVGVVQRPFGHGPVSHGRGNRIGNRGSSFSPVTMVFLIDLKTVLGRLACILLRLKTFSAQISSNRDGALGGIGCRLTIC